MTQEQPTLAQSFAGMAAAMVSMAQARAWRGEVAHALILAWLAATLGCLAILAAAWEAGRLTQPESSDRPAPHARKPVSVRAKAPSRQGTTNPANRSTRKDQSTWRRIDKEQPASPFLLSVSSSPCDPSSFPSAATRPCQAHAPPRIWRPPRTPHPFHVPRPPLHPSAFFGTRPATAPRHAHFVPIS